MGLYDNIVLPENFDLPDFPANPRYKNERKRLWQTKDLLCGQDRYRLRELTSEDSEATHQLERRVPPIQKMTHKGNWWMEDEPETTLLYWNIVRPTTDIHITDMVGKTMYVYSLRVEQGVLYDVEFVDARSIDSL